MQQFKVVDSHDSNNFIELDNDVIQKLYKERIKENKDPKKFYKYLIILELALEALGHEIKVTKSN
jgi:hypothetical protein